MQTFRVPNVVTTEDKQRGKVVRIAEEAARKAKTPAFFRDGLGECNRVANADDFTDDTRRPSGFVARARAAAWCERCPFSTPCLTWAVKSEQNGVFGGKWLRNGKEVKP